MLGYTAYRTTNCRYPYYSLFLPCTNSSIFMKFQNLAATKHVALRLLWGTATFAAQEGGWCFPAPAVWERNGACAGIRSTACSSPEVPACSSTRSELLWSSQAKACRSVASLAPAQLGWKKGGGTEGSSSQHLLCLGVALCAWAGSGAEWALMGWWSLTAVRPDPA